ncbi:MAG TPA: septum formation initiator family protein [Candidatus Sulfotelmatobacter sp.]|nr:septum formation initiator family protein [Candidatus Sulfotelmatobacter sp.]
MNSVRLKRNPDQHDVEFAAPAPVRRPKRNLLRRHWLSGALIFALVGISVYSGKSFFQTEQQLKEVRARAAALDQELEMKQRQSKALDDKLQQMTSDQYMEYLAKSMGYIYPGETVYQKGH